MVKQENGASNIAYYEWLCWIVRFLMGQNILSSSYVMAWKGAFKKLWLLYYWGCGIDDPQFVDNSPWVCHLHWKPKRLRVLLTNRVKYIAFDEENYKNISSCSISLVQTLMWHCFLHQASISNNVCHNKKGQVGIHPSSDSHFSMTFIFANLCLHQYIYHVLTIHHDVPL